MHVASTFSAIVGDFDEELTSLGVLVQIGQAKGVPPKTRVASIHATTLMLAAAFEEFIRQMARAQAIQVVERASSVADVPDKLLETAWKRTLNELARAESRRLSKKESLRMSLAKRARLEINALCSFVEGDIGQNIYDDLIHNEHNMRPGEVNRMFKISGLRNICQRICGQASLKAFFEQRNENHTHRDLLVELDNFIDRRNEITHSLNSASSSGPGEVFRIIEMFRAFAKDLGATLETSVGSPRIQP